MRFFKKILYFKKEINNKYCTQYFFIDCIIKHRTKNTFTFIIKPKKEFQKNNVTNLYKKVIKSIPFLYIEQYVTSKEIFNKKAEEINKQAFDFTKNNIKHNKDFRLYFFRIINKFNNLCEEQIVYYDFSKNNKLRDKEISKYLLSLVT